MAFFIQGAVKGVAAGIGLASESHQHRKEKKEAQKALEGQIDVSPELQKNIAENTTAHDFDPEKRHEIVWELDDAAPEYSSEDEKAPGYELPDYDHGDGKGIEDPKKICATFVGRHPPPTSQVMVDDCFLALPVVLPQRRPESRARGFIRAYAPLLEGSGIDEPTFLEFIHDLNVISLPDPKINAINLASLATQALPTVTGIIISRVIYKVTQAALEAHSRSKMNSYLDQMNEQYFKPRRLFCLVMTWNPSDPRFQSDVNLSQTLTHEMTASGPESTFGKAQHAMRTSSGQGAEFEFPETAPLVFPGLDALAAYDPKDPEGKKKHRLRSGKKFVDEYMDKRAHAKWAGANPDSQLAKTVKTSFKSRYADPNNPAASGDLLALVTGGKLNMMEMRGGMVGGGLGGGRGYGGGSGGGLEGGLGGVLGGGLGRFGGGGGYDRFGGGYDRFGGGYDRFGRGYDRFGGGGYDRFGGGGFDRFGERGYDRSGGRGGTLDPNSADVAYNDPRYAADVQGQQRGRSPSPYGQRVTSMGAGNFGRGGLMGGGGFGGGLMGMSPVGLILGGAKNLLQKNVLYLMIVQMPTDDELAEAAAMEAGMQQ